jgi:hypothetical protein
LNAFAYRRAAEQSAAIFSHDFFHPIHNHLSLAQELIWLTLWQLNQSIFKNKDRGGDYWHWEEEVRVKI